MAKHETVLQIFETLPPNKQEQVIEFARSLSDTREPNAPKARLRGLWRDLQIQISEEDIQEARREMWSQFPRETPR